MGYTPIMPPLGAPVRPGASPSRAAFTFLLSASYFSVSLATVAFVARVLQMLSPPGNGEFIPGLLSVLLLLAGFLLIARFRVPELRPLSALGFVVRPSAGREAALGIAAGWAVGIALVLPGLLLRRMHTAVVWDSVQLGAGVASLLALLLFATARQLVLCGLPFRSLTEATSPLFASIAFAVVAGLLSVYTAHAGFAEALLAGLAQLVFCTAAARTRAVWMSLALQGAWAVATTLLFGLPSFLWPVATGPIQSRMYGPRWLTGGFRGPEASLWAAAVVLVALMAMWRLTRDYAWYYTFDPIVGAGYAMDVPPPAEHTRMEQAAPLVQIGGLPHTAEGASSGANMPAENR